MTKNRILKSWLMPRLDDVIFFAVFFGAAAQGGRMMNIDGDLGRHLTIGEYILDQFRIPTSDIFSHTLTGTPLVPHEWLSEVIFAGSYRFLGFSGVILLSALVLAATFYILYLQAKKSSARPLLSAALVVLGIGATSFHWLTRPHLFSYLFSVIWIYLLEAVRTRRKGAWAYLPIVMLIWTNLHGSFVVGFAILGVYGAGLFIESIINKEGSHIIWGASKELVAGGAASFLASLINPAGLEIWRTSLGYLRNTYLTSHTWEYQAPNFRNPAFWPFLILIMIGLWLLIRQRGRVNIRELLLFATLGAVGLFSARAIAFFTLAVVPILAGWVSKVFPISENAHSFDKIEASIHKIENQFGGLVWPFEIAIGGVIWAVVFPMINPQSVLYAFSPKQFPVNAQEWIEEYQPQGNMFNYFPWGGYLLFENWPERKVFIDAQTDFYGESLTRQYEQVLTASPGWEEVLENYDVRWLIVPPEEPIASAIKNYPGWQQNYVDDTAVIWSYDP